MGWLRELLGQYFKDRIKEAGKSCHMELELQQFLFSYRNTPTEVTRRSLAEMMFNHKLRGPIDLLKPELMFVYIYQTLPPEKN